MSFEWPRIYKWDENIIYKIVEEAEDYVKEFYGIDELDELTPEQQNDIINFIEDPNNEHFLICIGLRNISEWFED